MYNGYTTQYIYIDLLKIISIDISIKDNFFGDIDF